MGEVENNSIKAQFISNGGGRVENRQGVGKMKQLKQLKLVRNNRN